MTIDGDHDTNSSRTTRSGKVFGEIRDSPEHDDESMDEDENQSVEEYGSEYKDARVTYCYLPNKAWTSPLRHCRRLRA
jgi:hypothetical protein